MAKKYSYKPIKSSYNIKKINSLTESLVKRRANKLKNYKVKNIKIKNYKY